MTKPLALLWLRRDLRLEDHALLAQAESEGLECVLAFVFDEKILKRLEKSDRRVGFIHQSLTELDSALRKRGSCLVVKQGDPVKEIPLLAKALGVKSVLATRDYEAYAKERDQKVSKALPTGVPLRLLKDQVIFEGSEILSGSGTPYKVFTAYKNEWLRRLRRADYDERGMKLPRLAPEVKLKKHGFEWSLKNLGFHPDSCWLTPGQKAAEKLLTAFAVKMKNYKQCRDFPAQPGTSGLSVHLRFGTISIRACVREALKQKGVGSETWLSELIWRDFYHMVLDQFPHVGLGEPFRKEYSSLKWPGKEEHFRAWCEGRTGYPLVDAAMRQLNETGWMHNRLRMVVASFLTKDLLIDWRKGEAYFAQHLLDFDFAANNGGWQWSASTGCDAQPYFRVFNPYSQSERFDPEGTFIREHVPELAHLSAKQIHCPPPVKGYPSPIVDHAPQRIKAIALFADAKKITESAAASAAPRNKK